MRLRRTAAGGIVALLGLASCSSGGGEARSTLPANTTTSGLATTSVVATTAPAVASTTTVVPTTAFVPATTTTSVVADATTADPKVLAQQLQAVVDRYVELYRASRTDPNRPFTDQQLLDQFRATATDDFIGTFLIPKWSQYRDEGTASRKGTSTGRRLVILVAVASDADHVEATLCGFNDGVTYRFSDGTVIDDGVSVEHGTASFARSGQSWLLDSLRIDVSEPTDAGNSPCEQG